MNLHWRNENCAACERVKMAFSTKLSYHMATITVYETMDTALTCRLAVSTECLPINTFILDVIYSLTFAG